MIRPDRPGVPPLFLQQEGSPLLAPITLLDTVPQADFIHQMGAFAERQSAVTGDGRRLGQSLLHPLFQIGRAVLFLLGVQPQQQFHKGVRCGGAGQELLVIRAFVVPASGQLLFLLPAPDGTQGHTASGAVQIHRGESATDMPPAIGLPHQGQ
jgi:hypothetical protein